MQTFILIKISDTNIFENIFIKETPILISSGKIRSGSMGHCNGYYMLQNPELLPKTKDFINPDECDILPLVLDE